MSTITSSPGGPWGWSTPGRSPRNGFPRRSIDGRIFPVWAVPKSGKKAGELDFMDHWYPIQVKQKDKAGRPDIDSFEAVMTRENRTKGFFVSFDFSSDAMSEIGSFFRNTAR